MSEPSNSSQQKSPEQLIKEIFKELSISEELAVCLRHLRGALLAAGREDMPTVNKRLKDLGRTVTRCRKKVESLLSTGSSDPTNWY